MAVASVLILALAAPSFAKGLSPESLARAAATAAAEPQDRRTTAASGGNKTMLWAGLGMAAAGGTLAALAGTALKKETCAAVAYGYSFVAGCVDETNKALLWTGIGLAGGGVTMMTLGAHRSSSIQVGPRSLTFRKTF